MKNWISYCIRFSAILKGKFNFLVLLALLITSCTPDPSYEMLKNYSFGFSVDGSARLLAGESVNATFIFHSPSDLLLAEDSVKVYFNVEKGGGTVNIDSCYAVKSKVYSLTWQLGIATFDQILRAKVYDLSGRYLSYRDVVAYGFRMNEWDALSTEPDNSITDLVADTVNDFTLAISGNKLYRQGGAYYIWNEVLDQLLASPRTIEIDSNGVVYVSTWNGDIVKSSDHGFTWSKCTRPYSAGNNYIYTYMANDNSLWVFRFDYPTRFSRDGGITWTDAGSGLSAQGYGDVFRLKNGSLLYHGSNCCSLHISSDNGLTWTKIVTPGSSLKLFVNELDEIFIFTQKDGLSFYKSADYGNTFTLIHKVNPSFVTSMENTFNRWGNFYYVCVPGYGIMKSADLTQFEIYWYNTGIFTMFIDHNGVFIAKDWGNSRKVYYRKNSGI